MSCTIIIPSIASEKKYSFLLEVANQTAIEATNELIKNVIPFGKKYHANRPLKNNSATAN